MADSDLTEIRIDGEQLVDGVLLSVYRDRVRLPDGSESAREWIDHPGAAAVVPLFEDGTTLLLRQYRYPTREVMVEVPAGKCDVEGEEPEEVARRELAEETGWRAERFSRMASLYPCVGYSNERIAFYLARDLSPARDVQAEETEFLEPFRVELDRAVERARSGAIGDMKTVVALLLAREELAS